MRSLPSAPKDSDLLLGGEKGARRLIVLGWPSWLLSGLVTVVWLVVILVGDLGGRVAQHWESSVTMLFGSFLAGSSPLGGGAVAFPVFTKAMDVPAPVARTFGLSIQAVGMTMAALSIMACRRCFHARAVVLGAAGAIIGFLLSMALLGQPQQPFWPPMIPSAWVKVTFSIVLATTSYLMVAHLRPTDADHDTVAWGLRLDVGLVLMALAGGVLSSLTGTGANILVFLFLVVIADVRPKTALPTAVMVMAAVSVVGFVLLGFIDGQMAIDVVGDRVTAVGGTAVDLPVSQADLLGLWLAAVPVVVWAAPLGSMAASLVREHHLIRFVAVLAGVEVLTTFFLVSELRTNAGLILYLVLGLALLPAAFVVVRRHRHQIFTP